MTRGVITSDYLKPTGDYPTHVNNFGRGGLHSYSIKDEMYTIPMDRRQTGMFVYIQDTSELYILLNNILNENFILFAKYIDTNLSVNLSLAENNILIGNADSNAIATTRFFDLELTVASLQLLVNNNETDIRRILTSFVTGIAGTSEQIVVDNNNDFCTISLADNTALKGDYFICPSNDASKEVVVEIIN